MNFDELYTFLAVSKLINLILRNVKMFIKRNLDKDMVVFRKYKYDFTSKNVSTDEIH